MIMLSSLQCGFKLFSNGKYKISQYADNQMFCCVWRRVYQSQGKNLGRDYRSTSFQNDQQNTCFISGLPLFKFNIQWRLHRIILQHCGVVFFWDMDINNQNRQMISAVSTYIQKE